MKIKKEKNALGCDIKEKQLLWSGNTNSSMHLTASHHSFVYYFSYNNTPWHNQFHA